MLLDKASLTGTKAGVLKQKSIRAFGEERFSAVTTEDGGVNVPFVEETLERVFAGGLSQWGIPLPIIGP